MKRLDPHQISGSELPSPPTSGDVLTYNATEDKAEWAAPPGGGGGGSGLSLDRRWNVGPGETSYDECDDDTIDPAYVAVYDTGGAGRLTWSEADSQIKATNTGGDTGNQFSALMRPLSGVGGALVDGDAFISCLTIGSVGSNYAFGGLVYADGTTFGAGAQLVATSHVGTSSADHFLRSFTNYTTLGTSVNGLGGVLLTVPIFVRLVYLGSNTWRRDLSSDGRTWRKGGANLTSSLTPTHVGFMSSTFGTGTAHEIQYEFLRRVSGIT